MNEAHDNRNCNHTRQGGNNGCDAREFIVGAIAFRHDAGVCHGRHGRLDDEYLTHQLRQRDKLKCCRHKKRRENGTRQNEHDKLAIQLQLTKRNGRQGKSNENQSKRCCRVSKVPQTIRHGLRKFYLKQNENDAPRRRNPISAGENTFFTVALEKSGAFRDASPSQLIS
jgi:hypothetical protein